MKTLEEYLKENAAKNVFTHALKVMGNGDIYVHPQNHDGDTLDYKVEGNRLIPKR